MKIYKKITETHIKKVIEDIRCNSCGKRFVGEYPEMSDVTEVQIDFGYGSRFDMESWTFDLCDQCLADITSKFEIPVDIDGD